MIYYKTIFLVVLSGQSFTSHLLNPSTYTFIGFDSVDCVQSVGTISNSIVVQTWVWDQSRRSSWSLIHIDEVQCSRNTLKYTNKNYQFYLNLSKCVKTILLVFSLISLLFNSNNFKALIFVEQKCNKLIF